MLYFEQEIAWHKKYFLWHDGVQKLLNSSIKHFAISKWQSQSNFFPTTMQDIAYHATMNLFFRVFLNSNHKISRHKSSRKFPPHLTVVLIEFRSEIYDLKNTLRRRDTNQRPSTTKVQFSTMLHTLGSNQLWNSNFADYFSFCPCLKLGWYRWQFKLHTKNTFTLKVNKSQKHFFLKLQCPNDQKNI